MKKLYNYLEAYEIVFKYLDKYWEKTKMDDLGGLLGGMDPTLFTDKNPANPRYLNEWEEITNKRTDISIEECFSYMIKFLELQNEWLDLQEFIDHLKKVRRQKSNDWKEWLKVE